MQKIFIIINSVMYTYWQFLIRHTKIVSLLTILLSINLCNAFGKRETRSVDTLGIAESANLFAEDFYESLIKPGQSYEDLNVLMSPLSINIGLAMLKNGAEGKTEQEISNGLRLNKDTLEADVNNGFTELISLFKNYQADDDDSGVQVQLANRIYVGQEYPIKLPFLDTVRAYYFADAERLNFGNMDSSAATVNGWIKNATRNRIKDIVVPSMLSNNTAMILVNAIHFKGDWKYPFNLDSTVKKRFKTLAGDEIPIDMMQLDRPRRFRYARLPELKSSAVALPYVSRRYSFIVLLPDRDQSLPEVEDLLKDGTLSEIPSRLRHNLVDVRLPKLSMSSSIDLIASKALEYLGMTSMTSEFANFSRLSNEQGLRITNVIHKAFLDINEAGSEAAAASAFVAQARSLDLDTIKGSPIQFVVDRPFIAFIYDSMTKTIMFITRKIA